MFEDEAYRNNAMNPNLMAGAVESNLAFIEESMERGSASTEREKNSIDAGVVITRFVSQPNKLPRSLGLARICRSIGQYVQGLVS